MSEKPDDINSLDQKELARLILDCIHRTVMHHVLWYGEVQQKLGREKALTLLQSVFAKSSANVVGRLARTLDFDMEEEIPGPLLALSRDKLEKLIESVAVNWLAIDGIWFQAVEFDLGMTTAKECNDSCWAQFSPVEARSIKTYLDMPENPGLVGLKKALQFRLYAVINCQSITDETANSFIFKMNECRVQAARKRKGLPDYSCKSAGIVEYTSFAQAVDSRIKTGCVACPPDKHPQDWFCSWKFYM